jgi:starch phosphorylase
MYEKLGDENMFLFGLNARQVGELRRQGYKPYEYYTRVPGLKDTLDFIAEGFGGGAGYSALINRLLFGGGGQADEYMLLADFDDYRGAHRRAGEAYLDKDRWNRMSLLNIARSGGFAADRSIREYAREIWDVPVREL